MREILFRAKRTDNGEWINGYYVRQDETSYCFKEDYESHPENTKHYIVFDMQTDWGIPNRHLVTEIDPETLCQYTGLKDKNGNRIWENDIVSCEHEKYPENNPLYYLFPFPIKYNRNYAVEFINTGSSYGYRLRNKSIHFMLTGNVIYNHEIKVLGNVFDNPELLKGVD